MLLGVVSDTHNNLKNIKTIINLFNEYEVNCVVHTGDITSASTLEKFSALNVELYVVLGNNDREEKGLNEIAEANGFHLSEPPFSISKYGRNIVIFHEPDFIKEFLTTNENIDMVLHGHTHRFKKDFLNSTLVFNPGESAGMLKGKNAIGIIDLKDLSTKRIFF